MELAPHPVIPKKKPVLVCILDGWGENKIKDEYNACHVSKSPTMDALAAKGPDYYRTVLAHGPAVGLPTDQDMGNSEVRDATHLGNVREGALPARAHLSTRSNSMADADAASAASVAARARRRVAARIASIGCVTTRTR